jgi:hypothetical protein
VADSGGGRNVLLQPFSTYSPWNMPLGTGTTYEAVGLGTTGKPAIPNVTVHGLRDAAALVGPFRTV